MTWNKRFDDSEVEEKTVSKMPEPGIYLAECMAAEAKESSNGNGMLAIVFELAEWPAHPEYGRRKVYDNLMLTGKGAGIGAAKSKAMGVSLQKDDAIDEMRYIGAMVKLHLKVEEYDNKKRLKVDISGGDYCGYDPVMSEGDIPF